MKPYIDRILSLFDKIPKGKELLQFIKFGIVGISNTLLSLLVTYLILGIAKVFISSLDTTILNIATTIGYIAGVINSYYWNKRYVFVNSKESNTKRVFIKMSICYGFTYLLSVFIMDFLVTVLSVPVIIAPIPRLLITIPLNFIMNKVWAFKDK